MVFLKTILIFGIGIASTILYGILALSADDILLSKFHQNKYKLRDLRADVVSFDRKFFDKVEIKTFKFNRTTTAFNSTVITKYDFGKKLDIVVQAYKRASNEYRLFPLRMRNNFCKYYNDNVFGLREHGLRCGNWSTCEWKKGVVYFFCNFAVDDTRLPPLIPTGEFKVQSTAIFEDKEILVWNSYAEVYLPFEIPKN